MRQVYTTPNIPSFWMVKSLLEANEIECEVRNEMMISVAGEVPFDQCWPQLYVVDDNQEQTAKEKIAEFLFKTQAGSLPSFCPQCDGEQIQFEGKPNGIFFPRFKCGTCGHIWQH